MIIERKYIDHQINRIYLSVKDIESSIEFASEATKARKKIVRRALITAAIISYSRPFSGNKSHRNAASTPKLNLAALSSQDRSLHKKLCDIRNRAIAHSDFSMNPCRPVMLSAKRFVMQSRLYDPLSDLPEAKSILALGENVKRVWENELFNLSRQAAQLASKAESQSASL